MKMGGISKRNRELLSILNRAAKNPFSLAFVSNILNISEQKAKNIVTYWVGRGWLTRVKRGLYNTVSLSTVRPETQKEDPWIVANTVFNPCYIGGWSACEHWGFTEQIFNDVAVFSARRFNRKVHEIQGTCYIVKTINKKRFYGLKPVWRGTSKISVSDPSRTIIDLLDDPKIGGGIRNIADMINEYFDSDKRDDKALIEYLSIFRNRVICKRLGYLIEYLKIEAPELIKRCEELKSSGYTKLDPTLPVKGKLMRRWNLRLNANLEGALK